MEQFKVFEEGQIIDNVNSAYAIGWLAPECVTTWRPDAGDEAAERFAAEPIVEVGQY